MRYARKPKNFEAPHEPYLAIGYYRGKAIVKDEEGNHYFVECEENELPAGTLAEKEILQPISRLGEGEQLEIMDIYGNRNE